MRSFQKNATFLHFFAFLQKNVAFFAFFYVLQKRTLCSLHSFAFLRKERKSMHRSFGFHKLPKTQKRMQKNIGFFKRMQKNDLLRMQCPTLDLGHLKGQCHKIFDPNFFSSIGYSQAPDPHAEVISKNISNSQRYLIAKCEKCVSAHYCTVVLGCESGDQVGLIN